MTGRGWKSFLDPADKDTLEGLYLTHAVATDQLRRDPETLSVITRTFNQLTGRNDSSSDLLSYMMNRRKGADWPRLGSAAKQFEPVTDTLTDEQLEALRRIYVTMDIPSDQYVCRATLAKQIADSFESITGTRIAAQILVAVIVAKRKRGVWVRIRDAFGDLDQVLGA
jgi:hypothetical protein